jgi:hypothetical protein
VSVVHIVQSDAAARPGSSPHMNIQSEYANVWCGGVV